MTARRALARASLIAVCAALAVQAHAASSVPAPAATALQPSGHFHPKGKPPSKYTVEQRQALRASLPFEDQRDFEESKRGFVAAPSYKQIKGEAGTSPGTWAASGSCSRARISTASTRYAT